MALTRRTKLGIGALFLFLATAWSQSVAPTNSTPSSDGDHVYSLKTSEGGMDQSFTLDPLTDNAHLSSKKAIEGTLILATPQNASNVPQGGIAYISCDPEAYAGGNIDASKTIDLATTNTPGAVILFSNTSAECSFGAAASFGFDVIYSMVAANNSTFLQSRLLQGRAGSASIQMTSGNGNDSAGDTSPGGGSTFGHSPTTAVAMIILYSITGIITALFLVIIIVGAVRAHRHPERYGPRNIIGRARQSRAKGIARAMLDTLPIVKFGEREADKPAQATQDVEMGHVDGQSPRQPETTEQRQSTEAPAVAEAQPQEGPESVTTETAVGVQKASETEPSGENNAENGLACSVCVDDFVKGQDIRVLPCNHRFHPECIDPWLLNVSGTCPLCRVDLRPTASHPSRPTSEDRGPDDATTDNPEAARSMSDQISGASRADGRRSRTGLSLYIQYGLNRARMRDATPEERLAALRRLRTVDRANEGESGGAINRLSARLSRAFDHNSRRGSYAG